MIFEILERPSLEEEDTLRIWKAEDSLVVESQYLKYRIKISVNRRFNDLCWKLLKLTIIEYHDFHTFQLILIFSFSKLPTSKRSDFPIRNLNIFETSNLSTFESRNQKLQIATIRSIEFRGIEIDNRRNFVERSNSSARLKIFS